jgi:hypothetical protein
MVMGRSRVVFVVEFSEFWAPKVIAQGIVVGAGVGVMVGSQLEGIISIACKSDKREAVV